MRLHLTVDGKQKAGKLYITILQPAYFCPFKARSSVAQTCLVLATLPGMNLGLLKLLLPPSRC